MGRGADGLTGSELRASRGRWWDAEFTRLLDESIPRTARVLVEVGSGLGAAAHALVPLRDELRYVGIDLDRGRLEEARRDLAAAGLADRASVVAGTALSLPVADASADVWLSVMTLQHLADPVVALAEARRVLRPGGRLVAVEPDNTAQRAYFDGELGAVSAALAGLAAAARAARAPADLAIGPRVPRLLAEAGFGAVTVRAHLVQSVVRRTAAEFFAGLGQLARTLAGSAGLPPDHPAVAACDAAIAAALATTPPAEGLGITLVPVFASVGERP